MVEELKRSMVIGWEVLELTESEHEGKTRKNLSEFFISCDPQGVRPALKKKKRSFLNRSIAPNDNYHPS
jgi:hypothetical protein